MPRELSLQERYAPASICYGCGPANTAGLQVRSYVDGDRTIAEWMPQPHHQAFPGVLAGGVVGTLLDCHSNWTAAWRLMLENATTSPVPTVTMEYAVKLRKPTPVDGLLLLVARPVNVEGRVVTVEAELLRDEVTTASCRGLFIAVKPDHPAYRYWNGPSAPGQRQTTL